MLLLCILNRFFLGFYLCCVILRHNDKKSFLLDLHLHCTRFGMAYFLSHISPKYLNKKTNFGDQWNWWCSEFNAFREHEKRKERGRERDNEMLNPTRFTPDRLHHLKNLLTLHSHARTVWNITHTKKINVSYH